MNQQQRAVWEKVVGLLEDNREYIEADERPEYLALYDKAIADANALLEQPEQEPVAWITEVKCVGPEYGKKIYGALPVQSLQPGYYAHTPLYTTPQAQPAVLSLEESLKITKVCCGDYANCHAPCTPRGRWQAQPAAWVGLTDEEILEAAGIDGADSWIFETAYAIEAKLREKNGGAA
jgi:hypothetical protein